MAAQVSASPERTERIPRPPSTLRLLESEPPAAPEPLWIGSTLDATKREVRSYLRTAWAFGTRPQATARAWAAGRFEAQNPLGYLLNSLAIIGPWQALWQRILGLPDLPFARDLITAVTPFLAVLATGSLHHLLFRALGSRRHIQSSWAISIYSTGGLPTVVGLLVTPFALKTRRLDTLLLLREHWKVVVALQAISLLTLAMQNAALSGLYGTSRPRAALVQLGSGALAAVAVIVLGTQLTVIGMTLKAIASHL